MLSKEKQVRVRSCGILVEDHKILLVELLSPITNSYIWIPPGGGVELGETLKETVKREFFEETGLTVSVQELMHVNELVQDAYHVIEFYHRVERLSGELSLGTDPEYSKEDQIIRELAFKSKAELAKLNIVPSYLLEDLWKEID